MYTVTSKSWSHEDGVVPVAPTSWQHILTTLRRHCSNAAPPQAVADDFTLEGLPHLLPSPTLCSRSPAFAASNVPGSQRSAGADAARDHAPTPIPSQSTPRSGRNQLRRRSQALQRLVAGQQRDVEQVEQIDGEHRDETDRPGAPSSRTLRAGAGRYRRRPRRMSDLYNTDICRMVGAPGGAAAPARRGRTARPARHQRTRLAAHRRGNRGRGQGTAQRRRIAADQHPEVMR